MRWRIAALRSQLSVPNPSRRPDPGDWLCFARSSPTAAALAALPASVLFRSVRGKLALFRTMGLTGGTGRLAKPCPSLSVRELALFCRGRLLVKCVITLFPQSTCPSYRSGGIGFVSHNWCRRGFPPRPCRLSSSPVSAWRLALFRTNPHHGDIEDTENEVEGMSVKESKITSVISVPLWQVFDEDACWAAHDETLPAVLWLIRFLRTFEWRSARGRGTLSPTPPGILRFLPIAWQ
jgi:hypothetical protein